MLTDLQVQGLKPTGKQYIVWDIANLGVPREPGGEEDVRGAGRALERAPRMDEVTYQCLARAARLRFGAPAALPAPPAAQEPAAPPTVVPQPTRPGLATLPHKVDVVFPDHDVALSALLDSGASMSCLPADKLRVASGRARFVLMGKEFERLSCGRSRSDRVGAVTNAKWQKSRLSSWAPL